jgi:bifunctional non-homologous end joining protein LigD
MNAVMTEMPVYPMLAKDSGMKPPRVPADPNELWTMEPKLDGWRFIWHVKEEGVRVFGGRNGLEHTGDAPIIEEALAEALPPGTVLDSELVAERGDLSEALSDPRKSHLLRAYVFDAMFYDGSSLMGEPWANRRRVLESMSILFPEEAQLVPSVPLDQELYERWLDDGFEGAVIKRKSSLYLPGSRRQDWTKLKPQATAEAQITGYEMGKGESNGDRVGALKVQLLDTGNPTTTGWDGTVAEAEALFGRICELRHHGWTKHGKVRHPVFFRMREDRDKPTNEGKEQKMSLKVKAAKKPRTTATKVAVDPTVKSPARKEATGRVRNLAAMGLPKLEALAIEMEDYKSSDPEAYAAVQAELEGRAA